MNSLKMSSQEEKYEKEKYRKEKYRLSENGLVVASQKKKDKFIMKETFKTLSLAFLTLLLVSSMQLLTSASAQSIVGLTAEKTAVVNDNPSGVADTLEPGETVTYTVVIRNNTGGAVTKVHFSDIVDTDTTLDLESVTTTMGLEQSTETTVDVAGIDDLADGDSVTIEYTVALNDTCNIGVLDISNQGSVSGEIAPVDPSDPTVRFDFFTDDPDTAAADDATVTPATDHACGTIGDLVFDDVDGSGTYDMGEPGVGGVVVNLWIDNDGNGVPDNQDTQIDQATTDSGGLYSFPGLVTGTHIDYILEFFAPTGMQFITQDVGTDEAIDSDANSTTGLIDVINLSAGETKDDVDVGLEAEFITVSATKTDAITGAALTAGDTVTYTVEITNESLTTPALKVIFSDVLDADTTLVAGTVELDTQTVTNSSTTGGVEVNVGDIPAGETVTITFDATLNDVCGITDISNQGAVSGNNFNAVVTDDPDTTTVADDATSTPVDNPCQATIGDQVWKDANGNGIRDTSEVGQDGVTVELYVDADSDGVADSATPVATDETANGGMYEFTVTDVSTDYVVRFVPMASMPFTTQDVGTDETIDSDADATTGFTATISVSDGDTITDLDAGMIDVDTVVTITKTDSLITSVQPGDTITYTVVLTNTTAMDAHDVIFEDMPDANTSLVVSSVLPSQGTVATGNAADDTSVFVNVGTIVQGTPVTITFDVVVDDPLASGVTQVENQGIVDGINIPRVGSDDPDTTDADDSTITPVSDPRIGVAKSLESATANADGTHTVSYDILVQNSGNLPLNSLQILDDLGTTFVGGPSINSATVSSTDLSVNQNYDGLTDTNLLAGTDSLAVGDSASLTLTVNLNLNSGGFGPYNNTASASGTTTGNVTVSDTSQNGTSPDSDGNGNPYDNNEPTPVTFTALDTASLGNKVFKDANENGIQDTGEVGVDGVTVEIYLDADNDGTPDSTTALASVQTANGGMYGFTDIDTTDNYILRFVPMASMPFTLQDQGTDDSLDSDVNADGYTGSIALGAGENNIDYDAGVIDADTTVTATKIYVVRNVDTGASELLEPEENVGYAVEITNTSNVIAKDVIFTDTPDANTTLLHSVITSQGTVVIGNTTGDTSIEVNIGDIAPGETVTVQFNAELNNPIPASVSEIRNQGTVDGSNIPVTLTDDPNTTDVADPTVTPVSDPRIGLAKTVVGTPTANSDGSHSVTYSMTVLNMGNRPLNNLQITDDLGTTFVGGPSINSAMVSSTDLSVNQSYNGLSDSNLLAGTDSLAVGESASLSLTVNVNLNSGTLGPYNNSAIASGTTPESVTVSDTSQEGGIDPDNNGNPYDNNEPTPVSFTEQANVVDIALAKSSTVSEDVDSSGNAVYRITYDFILTNSSNVTLNNVQVTDNLVVTTDGLEYTVIGTSTSSNLTVNPNFDGNADKNLLSGTDSLAAGVSATIKLDMSIAAGQITSERVILNSATVTATGPDNAVVSDVSQDGSNPDPDGNGAGDNSDPTVVTFSPGTITTPTIDDGQIRVQKVVLSSEYQIGTAVIYRLTVINDSTAGAAIVSIADTPDRFLRYIPNSTEVRVSGVTEVQSLEPTVTNGVLTWDEVTIPAAAANETGAIDLGQVEITYKMRVLPGASGKLRNSATVNAQGGTTETAVNVNADILPGSGPFSGLPEGTVVGRVFADVDGDRQYTVGIDQPIGGARLILCNGWQVRTDVEGNYTFREVPEGTDCVQLDKHSIPFEVDGSNISSGSGYVQMTNSFGLSTNNFVLKVGTGSVKALRETTVVYGPITVVKRHIPLENGNVRVELDVEVSEMLPYGVIITDRIPDAAQPDVWDLATTREFELGMEAKHYDFNYELPANTPMTDLELAPKQ